MRIATISIAVALACSSVGCWVHREPEHARREERREEKREHREDRHEHHHHEGQLGVSIAEPPGR